MAIWGGYEVYKRTSNNNDSTELESVPEETTTVTDTTANKTDSLVARQQSSNIPAGSYKFVLEKTNGQRAISRFNSLKSYGWNVQLETADSVSYTLFMVLPVTVADTSKVLDSLSTLTGRKVVIE